MPDLVKKCIKCNKKKPLTDYYVNTKWREELYRDRWCKNCIQKLIIDERTLKMYFEDNRRVYPNNYWGIMYEKAKITVQNERPALKAKERNALIIRYTRGHCFKLINFKNYYKFVETELVNEKEEDQGGVGDIKEVVSQKVYNVKWCGYYSEQDIKYLENYYRGLDNDFNLSNHAYRDYAKKVCKASLAMDNAYADMVSGVENADKKYKEMKAIFDSLSQSAKFAEKTRSSNDVVGFGSLGELTAYLEENGFLIKPIKFPDDDIDLIVDDFRWVISSVGEKF